MMEEGVEEREVEKEREREEGRGNEKEDIYIYILGHLADAFIQRDLQRFIHTLTAVSTMQFDSPIVDRS